MQWQKNVINNPYKKKILFLGTIILSLKGLVFISYKYILFFQLNCDHKSTLQHLVNLSLYMQSSPINCFLKCNRTLTHIQKEDVQAKGQN